MLLTTAVVSLLAGSLLGSSSARTLQSRWNVHEKRDSIPTSFVESGVAPLDKVLNMRINLVMGDQAGLEAALDAASNPKSPTFREWLSKEQVEAFAKPSSESTQAVTDWLSTFNITATSATPAGDWLAFQIPVSTANAMLNTQYSVFTEVATGKTQVLTTEYSLPSDVQQHIKAVHPTTSFGGSVRHVPATAFKPVPALETESTAPSSDATVPSSCNSTITPACLQALYNIPTTPASAGTKSTLGVAAFDEQNANLADLKQFLTALRPDMNSSTAFTVTLVDDATNSQTLRDAGVEADLDIQYTVGLATGIPVDFVDVGEKTQDGADEGFLDIINALLDMDDPPLVFTTSYGFDTEASLSESLTVAMCNSYMQLTARGVSILFASGDGGVASTPGVQCSATFPPTFPTCPYATLVGATENVNPEIGAELSAGGFSNYFARPSWQDDAVEAYLDFLGDMYAGKFNASGRAYPDVSAQGQRVEIVDAGRTGLVAGTSCASPIFSSVVALINDDLLAAGQSPLGFLNPWIYAHPEAFNDITIGNNPGCGTDGFFATTGFDPVTGMGSPNYLAMRTAAGLS